MRVNDRHVSFYYENDMDIGEIVIDKKKTALLVIDMQHVFITRPVYENPTEEQKREAERWEPFYSKVEQVVVPNNAKLLKAFREQGMEVCFAKIQCLKKNGSDRSLDQKATGYNELLLPPGTPSAEIVPELAPLAGEDPPLGLRDLTAQLPLTFHNFYRGQEPCCKIDYLFATPQWKSAGVCRWMDEENGVYLSDHYPICARLTL